MSSQGGHFEQIKSLSSKLNQYDFFVVTEKTKFINDADYHLPSTGSNSLFSLMKVPLVFMTGFFIWLKEKPHVVITTGALICIPFLFLCKLFGRKIIYIETFARIFDASKTGKYMYKHADLFIVQWEELLNVFPDAIFGGSIY